MSNRNVDEMLASSNTPFVNTAVVLLLGIVLALCPVFQPGLTVWADEASSEKTSNEENAPAPRANRLTKPHVKALAVGALAGILIAGIAMLALVSVLGGRLRRQLRKQLPKSEPVERDFWFLKPPKPTVTESMLSDTHIPPHDVPPLDAPPLE